MRACASFLPLLGLLSACGSSGTHTNAVVPGVPDDGGKQHVVAACDGNVAVGVWEDVTPPGVVVYLPPPNFTTGSIAFVIDPVDPRNVYLGTHEQGIWHSGDCGATWVHANTGENGKLIDGGRPWAMVMDHNQVLYTNSGYGTGQDGFWKSTDFGVNWTNLLGRGSVLDQHQGDFIEFLAIWDKNPNHMLVSAHGACKDLDGSTWPGLTCFAHTTDGGQNWDMLKADPNQGYEAAGHLMLNANTWLFFGGSLMVTTNAGATWTATDIKDVQHQTGELITSDDGNYYLPTLHGVAKSPDGVNWTLIKDSPVSSSLAGDGTTLFASNRLHEAEYQTSTDDYSVWTSYPAQTPPARVGAWMMRYDRDHHLLYSSNENGGFWRIKTK